MGLSEEDQVNVLRHSFQEAYGLYPAVEDYSLMMMISPYKHFKWISIKKIPMSTKA